MPAKRIHLIRHGATESPYQGRYIGSTDVPLSSEGRRQASELASLIDRCSDPVLLCSPLQRCRDSAALACVSQIASLLIDHELPLSEMTPALMAQLDRLEPFGEQNEKPLFLSSDVRLARPVTVLGAENKHLRLDVRRGDTTFKALAFGMGDRRTELAMGRPLHLVYTPRWNHWRGQRTLELMLADFAVGEAVPGIR